MGISVSPCSLPTHHTSRLHERVPWRRVGQVLECRSTGCGSWWHQRDLGMRARGLTLGTTPHHTTPHHTTPHHTTPHHTTPHCTIERYMCECVFVCVCAAVLRVSRCGGVEDKDASVVWHVDHCATAIVAPSHHQPEPNLSRVHHLALGNNIVPLHIICDSRCVTFRPPLQ
jgi:hypothetical protein